MRATSIVVAALLVSCGDNIKPALPDAAPNTACGNGVVETGEGCDDGDEIKDIVCDATCQLTCGNGAVDSDVGELCDTGIGSGPGSCPSACDDGMACTDDVLSSSGCTAECVHSDITVPADGDGCCPPGADATTDDDCSAICGNSVVEAGEACDTGIVAGPGACPMVCDDMLVCTTNVLDDPGTCLAACSFPAITMPANGDGCCPAGANAANDDDCIAMCGNGVHEPPSETCDTGISAGPGSCPMACDDGDACTTNTLGNAGTCQAVCVFPPVTTPNDGDGCCPPGANANNDDDCMPVCGNGVVEPGEPCDDGNMNDADACANDCTANVVPTAFRLSDLDLRDPHVHVAFIGCNDVTDNQLAGFSVNNELQTAIQTDDDGDGFLDLSPTLVFRPFSQTAATMPVEVHFADCTAPIGSTTCTPGGGTVTMATATNMTAGQCLTFLPGTVRPYTPAVTSPSGPCFVTSPITVTLTIGGIDIPLQDAQVAATYVGNPATSLTNGLLRGFISEADANATIIPTSFPLVGGDPLSSLLAGGAGACPSFSDKDTSSGVMGWWFYLNFPATRVTWMD